MLFLSSADFFQNQHSQKNLSLSLSASNSLDPDLDRYSVAPDLDPNSRSFIIDYLTFSFT